MALCVGTQGAAVFAETWERDGEHWSLRDAASAVGFRNNAALAYDAKRARMALFGGAALSGVPLGDTWEWDGVQ